MTEPFRTSKSPPPLSLWSQILKRMRMIATLYFKSSFLSYSLSTILWSKRLPEPQQHTKTRCSASSSKPFRPSTSLWTNFTHSLKPSRRIESTWNRSNKTWNRSLKRNSSQSRPWTNHRSKSQNLPSTRFKKWALSHKMTSNSPSQRI